MKRASTKQVSSKTPRLNQGTTKVSPNHSQENSNHDDGNVQENTDDNSFFQGISFNQMISAAGIIVFSVGLYLKRKELMSAFQSVRNNESPSQVLVLEAQ